LNVCVAVLRNQTEITVRCVNGEYAIETMDAAERLRTGEEQFFSLAGIRQTAWCKRTRVGSQPFDDSFPTGVVGATGQGEISSRRWFALESATPPESSDPLFAQAVAIARSESLDGELYYRDERPFSDPTIVMGWRTAPSPVVLRPLSPDAELKIYGIRVGIGFHWDAKHDLQYRGAVHLYSLTDGLCAVIETPLEDYLAVVNSSEMPADLPLEFLKVQTVAARSWLLANLGTHHPGAPFDVCSDDHCQCYHGSVKLKESSIQATRETAGQVLVTTDSAGKRRITDARYAKTCGGRFEPGERIWGGETPGLLYGCDNVSHSTVSPIDSENVAVSAITNNDTDDYCNPKCHPYPASLDYCSPYYRWKKEIDIITLSEWIIRATGVQIGIVSSIDPLERGPSGRLHRIKIIGTVSSVEIKGELAIRRALSDTHLPSSAFLIDIKNEMCTIIGAGWGHGAGLCQTGAAVRATLGQNYREILQAYYSDSSIEEIVNIQR